MYFDSHCHYDFKQFNSDREILLSKTLPDYGVKYLLNVGCNMSSSKDGLALANKYDYIYASVGYHPHNAKELRDEDLAVITKMTEEPKVVAIGEIGLDFHYNHSPKEVQIRRFKEQLDLAVNLNMPVIVHSRDADDEVFKILKQSGIAGKKGGVLHCFSGDLDLAVKYTDLGFYLGIGGVVTYKNAKTLREVAKNVPIQHLLIETDCPYLSPEPFRGQKNDSRNLRYIVETIGKNANLADETVAQITLENAKKLFSI